MCSGGRMKSYALSLVALLAFLSCAPVCQARDFELVIAHVNDTHSHAAGTDLWYGVIRMKHKFVLYVKKEFRKYEMSKLEQFVKE